MSKIQKSSCIESQFLRDALSKIATLCEDDTPVHEARFSVCEIASEALGDPAPGGNRPCSCDEALHLRRALRACFNVTQSEDTIPVEDLAQCNNFAAQGQRLQALTGDPAVYDVSHYVPAEHDVSALYLGAALDPANDVTLLDALKAIRSTLESIEAPGNGLRPTDVRALCGALDGIAENAAKLRGVIQYGKNDPRARAFVKLVAHSLQFNY